MQSVSEVNAMKVSDIILPSCIKDFLQVKEETNFLLPRGKPVSEISFKTHQVVGGATMLSCSHTGFCIVSLIFQDPSWAEASFGNAFQGLVWTAGQSNRSVTQGVGMVLAWFGDCDHRCCSPWWGKSTKVHAVLKHFQAQWMIIWLL